MVQLAWPTNWCGQCTAWGHCSAAGEPSSLPVPTSKPGGGGWEDGPERSGEHTVGGLSSLPLDCRCPMGGVHSLSNLSLYPQHLMQCLVGTDNFFFKNMFSLVGIGRGIER